MVIREEHERVRTLLSDTITLLCRNGLTFKTEFNIKALIGITLDKNDVFLVDIQETIKNAAAEEESEAASEESSQTGAGSTKSRRRKRRRKQDRNGHESSSGESDNERETHETTDLDSQEPPTKRPSDIKQEAILLDEDSDQLVFIKDEPGTHADLSAAVAHSDSFMSHSAMSNQSFGTPGGSMMPWDTSNASPHIPSTSSQGAAGMGPAGDGASPGMSQTLPLGGAAMAGGGYQCRFCPSVFRWKHTCARHERQHQPVERVACPRCPRTFSRRDNMLVHLRCNHPDGAPATG